MKATKSNLIPIAVLILCCLAFLLLSYLSCGRLGKMASAMAGETSRTIVIDPGHGGEDGGATGKSGVQEKDINLAVATDLQQLLQASGMKTVMTRTADVSISDHLDTVRERKVSDMHNRLKIVESQENCVFVSIHQNYFTQSQYRGAQIFYSKNNEGSKILAESIREELSAFFKTTTRAKRNRLRAPFICSGTPKIRPCLWNAASYQTARRPHS